MNRKIISLRLEPYERKQSRTVLRRERGSDSSDLADPKLEENSDEKDMLVAWTEFLKNPESERVRTLEMNIEEIRRAKDQLIKMSNDKEQREIYEMREKILKDKVSALNKAREEGIQEGIEKGIEEGIEKQKENSRLKDVERVIKLLTKKFKNLDENLEKKIRQLDSEILNLIIEEILDIENLEDVQKYL